MNFDDGEWERYEAQLRPRRLGKSEVSLTKTNIIYSKELGVQFQASRVVFEFCSSPRAIKLRPAAEDEAGYNVSYRSVSSRSFYQHFNITERGRFKASIQNDAIVIPLPNGKENSESE